MAEDPIKVVQKTFFDRPKVISAIGRKNAAVLARTGGFARKVMQRGMRRSARVSAPQAFPHAHGGRGNSLLRDLIFFGYEDRLRSVVIGPVLVNPDHSILSGKKRVPRLVNEGGVIRRRVSEVSRSGRNRVVKIVTQRYRPRPFVKLTMPFAAKALADNMAKVAFK
jgi:hypothetical protein